MNRSHRVFTVLQYGVNLPHGIYFFDSNQRNLSYVTNIFFFLNTTAFVEEEKKNMTYVILYTVMAISRL